MTLIAITQAFADFYGMCVGFQYRKRYDPNRDVSNVENMSGMFCGFNTANGMTLIAITNEKSN